MYSTCSYITWWIVQIVSLVQVDLTRVSRHSDWSRLSLYRSVCLFGLRYIVYVYILVEDVNCVVWKKEKLL